MMAQYPVMRLHPHESGGSCVRNYSLYVLRHFFCAYGLEDWWGGVIVRLAAIQLISEPCNKRTSQRHRLQFYVAQDSQSELTYNDSRTGDSARKFVSFHPRQKLDTIRHAHSERHRLCWIWTPAQRSYLDSGQPLLEYSDRVDRYVCS